MRSGSARPDPEMTRRATAAAPLLVAALCACAALGPQAPARDAAPDGALAITHVTLIDGRGGAPRPEMTVVVRGDTVIAVGPSDETAVPAGARGLDASGRRTLRSSSGTTTPPAGGRGRRVRARAGDRTRTGDVQLGKEDEK